MSIDGHVDDISMKKIYFAEDRLGITLRLAINSMATLFQVPCHQDLFKWVCQR